MIELKKSFGFNCAYKLNEFFIHTTSFSNYLYLCKLINRSDKLNLPSSKVLLTATTGHY